MIARAINAISCRSVFALGDLVGGVSEVTTSRETAQPCVATTLVHTKSHPDTARRHIPGGPGHAFAAVSGAFPFSAVGTHSHRFIAFGY